MVSGEQWIGIDLIRQYVSDCSMIVYESLRLMGLLSYVVCRTQLCSRTASLSSTHSAPTGV